MGREWPKATALAAGAALLLVGSSACARSTRTTATAAEPTAVAVVRVSGSGTAMPVVRRLAEAYRTRHTDVQFRFESGTNSAGPIQAVVEGSLDLAASIRPLTNEQLQAGLREAPFAREAIVFAGNLVPEVNALTSAQVKDIYAGRVTSWDALGGPAEPIILLDRDADETQRKQVFLPLVDHLEPEAVVTVLNSSPDMLRALGSTPRALGYTGYGLLKATETVGPRVLALDGVAPSADTLADGSYPWHLTLSLVSGPHSPPAALGFSEFVVGPVARALLLEYGYGAP